MDNISCNDFFERSGWHCQTIETGSRIATYISTPFTLRGGKSLDFYLFAEAGNLEFTDDGITLFALRSLGYPLGDKRNWRSLENIAIRHGFSLSDAGAFETVFIESELSIWGAKILRLFSSIATWEEDRFSEGDTEFSLTQEVELMLRAKDPTRHLDRNVLINVGGTGTHFDFLWGSTYVDSVTPTANAINARLRKALLVNKAEDPVDMLFIVDDRDKPTKADEEIAVLGDLAPTIRITDFEQFFSPGTH
ncbi:DUF1828 domain-containing protein [Pseudomonas syringae group sp. J309-1]|uniref:DUF1828 domain-containing protein n=1 Tax=Pseudomonas syringae group sp. J309-1 TaxID=3079588 RepID=UPI00290E72E3|nr:DUF1828 domain-containing protein [Pseudomonas syringae group sp. J309-1]MDU8359409.1 DUF1828 domain-containing protein [Pseudomonas syringae group sp. J309-1]